MHDSAQGATATANKASLRLRLNEDRTSVLVDCGSQFPNLEDVIISLRESLEALGITDPIGQTASEHAFRAAIERGPLEGVPILEGRHPTPPQDEKMAWCREFFAAGFHVDPATGAVDYRRLAAEASVTEGELLGTITPGEEGCPGLDLFGNAVLPRAVEKVKIRPAKGVRYAEEERAFYTEVSGQVKLVGNALSVDTVVTVPGSVGLKTGNIRHPGALLVEQNIEAGSEVVAAGNVEVRGYVEDAVVSAGGRVVVHGGIMGERTIIKARGEVHAKYIMNAHVEAAEDVHVEREIDNATILTRGQLIMPNGRFVGGSCTALGGMTLNEVGSNNGLVTHICAGEDYALKRKLAIKQNQVDHLRGLLKEIETRIGPLRKKANILSEHTQQTLEILSGKVRDAEEKIASLETDMTALREASKARARNEVVIQKRLHSDTIFHISGMVLRNDQSVAGPVRVGIAEGELHLMAVTRR